MKSPRLGGRTVKSWQKIATHEVNHAVWRQLRGRNTDVWSPIWLIEALACYVARNDVIYPRARLIRILKSRFPPPNLYYRYRASLFPDAETVRFLYSLWFYFFSWLGDTCGYDMRAFVRKAASSATKKDCDQVLRKFCGQPMSTLWVQFAQELTKAK